MSAIGERAGIRGPSIYKHFSSKQDLLEEIMFTTMERLLKNNAAALSNTNDNVVAQLRSSVEMHARFHAHHGYEAFVGTREINSLNEPKRSELLSLRDRYERGFRELIERGRTQSLFHVESSRLASYAIIDMGMGIAVWFRDDGPFNADEVIRHYGSMALRLVGYVDPS
jgi:AcrR family transcriptional regulator